MKLICFPYAGATSSVFLKWGKYSDGNLEIIPLDPPGRGRRMAEPLCTTIHEAVEDLQQQVLETIGKGEEYAIYGHSLGCLLAYELLHQLGEKDVDMPVHVFLSGKNPPDTPVKEPLSDLDDRKFMKEIEKLGGTDARFFENPTLVKVYLPILRKDFKMLESYVYQERQKPPVDASFFFSSGDRAVCTKHVKRWSDFISGNFNVYHFKGDHFFIFDHQEKIMNIIDDTLSKDYCMPAY
ncbi:non-ribosomal peptide synthase [Bacteroidia bacterium]|nr:non-ribosomal peptide synthase [Bacteroidia bacterium]